LTSVASEIQILFLQRNTRKGMEIKHIGVKRTLQNSVCLGH